VLWQQCERSLVSSRALTTTQESNSQQEERYRFDCKLLHTRLQQQSHSMDQMTLAFAQLKTSYENDMKEVQSLTEVLQNSIVSLEFQLGQKTQQLQHLLRSELLEMLCIALTGSRVSTRSELVTAFWSEKPETRAQLLDWFSGLQSKDPREFHTPKQHVTTQHSFQQIHR
jgi:hypothetical protein